jgi:hypothetical protein
MRIALKSNSRKLSVAEFIDSVRELKGIRGLKGVWPHFKAGLNSRTGSMNSATGVLLFPLEIERWNKGLYWFSIATIGGTHISRMSPPVMFVLLYGCIFQLSVRGGGDLFHTHRDYYLPSRLLETGGGGETAGFVFPGVDETAVSQIPRGIILRIYISTFLSPSGRKWKKPI